MLLTLAGAAARGSAVTLVAQAARILLQLASLAILARLVTQADFGLVSMALAVVGVANVVSDFGLSMASIQAVTISQGQRSNLFWTNAAVGVGLYGIAFVSAPFIADFFGHAELTDITRVLSLTFVLSALAAQFRAEASIQLRFKWLAVSDLAPAAIALAVAVWLAIQGWGYWALVVQQIAIAGLTLLVLIVAAGWMPGMPRRRQRMRSLYAFGANSFGVQLLTYVVGNIDSVLIGRFWGATALGYYDRAFRIYQMPAQQIAAPLTRIAMPVLSRLQDDIRYEPYVRRAQVVLTYTLGGAFLFLAAASAPIVDLVLGEGWDDAKPILTLLALGGVFQAMGYTYYWIFLSRGLTGIQLRWSVVSRLLTVALMIAAIPLGSVGVAAAVSVGAMVNWILLTSFPLRHTRVSRSLMVSSALRPVVFLIPGAGLIYASSESWLAPLHAGWSVLIATALALSYLGVGFAVRPIRRDFRDLWDVARRLRR